FHEKARRHTEGAKTKWVATRLRLTLLFGDVRVTLEANSPTSLVRTGGLEAILKRSHWKEASVLANQRLSLRLSHFMLVVFAIWIALSTLGAAETGEGKTTTTDARLADGLSAWEQVYSVLTHPRCINCHTATNYPQQGDDRHRHFANVIRGPAGKGVPGLNCVSCHQETNA